MKKIATVILILTILASSAWAVEGSNADKTLSPYFFIQSKDENLDHFPLKKTDVEVVVSGVIADVTVRQHYSNNGNRPLNGRYIFPGSTRAAIHGMKMIIGERVITAKIKEKKEAEKKHRFGSQFRSGSSNATWWECAHRKPRKKWLPCEYGSSNKKPIKLSYKYSKSKSSKLKTIGWF
jgi:vault protein inter-alpha-trypsin-like protein